MNAPAFNPHPPRWVEAWRDGQWCDSGFPDLRVGEVFRMFEADGRPVPGFYRVEEPAVESPKIAGRYRVKSKPCDDPAGGG